MNKNYKVIIVILLMISLVSLGISFASYSFYLNVSVSTLYTAKDINVKIKNIELDNNNSVGCIEVNRPAIDINNPTDVYNINLKFEYPGATCNYIINVENTENEYGLDAIFDYQNSNFFINKSKDVENLKKFNVSLTYGNTVLKSELSKDNDQKLIIKKINDFEPNPLVVGGEETIGLSINYDMNEGNIDNNIIIETIHFKIPYKHYLTKE